MKSSSPALHRNIKVLGGVSFLNDFASEMIYPLLPAFLTGVLRAGPAALGLMEGVAESVAALLKLYSGWLSDRLRRRKALVVGGYLLSNLVRPLIGLASSWGAVMGLRIGDRIGKGLRTSPRDALIADAAPPEIRGRAFGLQRAMDHAGAVAGPLTATVLLAFFVADLRTVFLLSLIPGVITVLLLIVALKEKPAAARAELPSFFKEWSRLPGRFKYYLLVIFIFSLGNSTDAFLLFQAQRQGVTVALLPVLWMVFHMVKAGASTPGGALSDRIGRKPTLILGWLIYALVYAGFAWWSGVVSVWTLFLVYGLYYGLTESTERALVADLVPASLHGVAYGLYNFVMALSLFPASVIFGLIWKFGGHPPAFLFGAGMAFCALILLLGLPRAKSPIGSI